MYIYDKYDQKIVDERVAQFRDQTHRYVRGEITPEEFRPLRLMNGLYLQRHAPMLRVAIPYGLLSGEQMRMLAQIARRYDKGYGHFSTRQNIQYNWPELERVPDILAELASVQMHAIQTSGNCVRNISTDHLAGVADDEVCDPRPYCEILRQWSTLHPEFSYLPRKFKIAVTGASQDRAAVQVHDIGLTVIRRPDGEIGFRVLVGGGQGRTPHIGSWIREFLPERHLLSYLESILRVYNRLGERKNRNRARIKMMLKGLGSEKFTELVEKDWDYAPKDQLALDPAVVKRMAGFFTPPPYDPSADDDDSLNDNLHKDIDFNTWFQHNTVNHKAPGYRAVYLTLKSATAAPGDATAEQMEAVADMADRYSYSEVRTTHDQNLVLAHVAKGQLYDLWQQLCQHDLATPNIARLTDMICCPGGDFCSLANARSIPIARQISERFSDQQELDDLGEIRVKISGCMNACGHHHVGHIGILGVDKDGDEFYQLTLGGSHENDIAIGDRLGKALDKNNVIQAMERLMSVYVDQRRQGERFLDTYRRIGKEPFKAAVYPDSS